MNREEKAAENRIRDGDKTPTRAQINLALIICGDITSLLSQMVSV